MLCSLGLCKSVFACRRRLLSLEDSPFGDNTLYSFLFIFYYHYQCISNTSTQKKFLSILSSAIFLTQNWIQIYTLFFNTSFNSSIFTNVPFWSKFWRKRLKPLDLSEKLVAKLYTYYARLACSLIFIRYFVSCVCLLAKNETYLNID